MEKFLQKKDFIGFMIKDRQADHNKKFLQIKQEYAKFDNELRQRLHFIRDTEKGIWGPSNLDVVFELFKKIGLQNYKNFLDIGCGDGRVVLTASLFTKAEGIEFDEDLLKKGNEIKEKLKSDAELMRGDIFNHDFSGYDIIFINPDTGFHNGIEDKLLKELKGMLLVYNDIFKPRFLKRGRTYWIDQVPVTEYLNISKWG